MPSFEMSADDVALVSRAASADDWARVEYDGTHLHVPEDIAGRLNVGDEETLFAARKAAKHEALADRRWRAETGGAVVAGITVRTDATSQGKINGAVALFDKDETLTEIDFETQPGVWVTIDKATMGVIGIAVGRHVQGCFSHARTLSEAIAAAADVAGLEAIDIEAGWP